MSKKFYVGICCLALLASVASGYTEDFEGYSPSTQWTTDANYPTSGWGLMYEDNAPYGDPDYAYTTDATGGYNDTQGIAHDGGSGQASSFARLLDAAQGPNSTFVATVLVQTRLDDDRDTGIKIWVGDGSVTAPQDYPATRSEWAINENDGTDTGMYARVYQVRDDGATQYVASDGTGLDLDALGWVQLKLEIDVGADSKPTFGRLYARDMINDGGGPVAPGTWTKFNFPDNPTDAFLASNAADYVNGITDFGIYGFGYVGTGPLMDDITLTPEPATLAVLLLGGLVATLRRRR